MIRFIRKFLKRMKKEKTDNSTPYYIWLSSSNNSPIIIDFGKFVNVTGMSDDDKRNLVCKCYNAKYIGTDMIHKNDNSKSTPIDYLCNIEIDKFDYNNEYQEKKECIKCTYYSVCNKVSSMINANECIHYKD